MTAKLYPYYCTSLAHLFALFLPVVFSFGHRLDAVRERCENPSGGRFECYCLPPEVDIIHINWSVMQGSTTYSHFNVRVIIAMLVTANSRRNRFCKRERVASGSPVAL